MLFALGSLFLLVTMGNASPLKKRSPTLTELNHLYPGIFWDDVFTQCTEEQRNIIVESTRVVVNDVFPTFRDEQEVFRSAPFNRFFVRHGEPGFDTNWSEGHLTLDFLNIQQTFIQLPKFITEGGFDKNGELKRSKRIRYTCQNISKARPCTTGVGAQTHTPLVDPTGWATNFCPTFFDTYEYINELGNQPNKTIADLPLLHAREHIIIHELAHADVASKRFDDHRIVDVISSLPDIQRDVVINGTRLCHKFAWMHSKDKPSSINNLTSVNADSFAWVYTNAWFAVRYGWNDDGRTLDVSESDGELIPDASQLEDAVSADDLNNRNVGHVILPPPNCIKLSDDPTDVYCAFMPGLPEEWPVDKEQSFTSRGGCSLSKECHMPIVVSFSPVVDSHCICTCDGVQTPLKDSRCKGFEGFAPV